MIDLTKWNMETIQNVSKILNEKQLPCVGMCLLFMEPRGGDNVNWNFVTHLAFDKMDPPKAEDRALLEKAFEQVAHSLAMIMEGEDITHAH
jgi:hypothetical protein